MKNLNWKLAFESAALVAVIQFVIAVGSYLTGCAVFGRYQCSLEYGVKWISHHPVFPILAPKLTLAGFFVGLFIHLLGSVMSVVGHAIPQPIKSFCDRHKNLFAIVIVVILTAAFALWGLPEIILLRRLEATAPK
ncbi:MAG: hypothetical protein ACOZAA_15850 [Pseudomonadota bacterium]